MSTLNIRKVAVLGAGVLAVSWQDLIARTFPVNRRGRLLGLTQFLGAGMGTLLVHQLINIARERGLRHLSCMLISDLEADAVKTLEGLGFQSFVQPGYGTDPDGNQHDMTKLILKL